MKKRPDHGYGPRPGASTQARKPPAAAKTNGETLDRARAQPRRRVLNQPWKVRLAYAALWALLGIGALNALLSPARMHASAAAEAATRRATTSTASSAAPAGPQGFAQMCVAAYLQAGDDAKGGLAACYPTLPDLTGVRANQFYVTRTTVWDVKQVGDGYWSVTVGADLIEYVKGAPQPAGTRFYALGVQRVGDGYVATSLPSQMPQPPIAPAPDLAAGDLVTPDPANPIADTVQRFAGAFLASNGELDRYLAPGLDLRPVQPAPCIKVEVRSIGLQAPNGKRTDPYDQTDSYLVRFQVVCTDSVDHMQLFDYSLDLHRRADRWEVTRLNPAIPLATKP